MPNPVVVTITADSAQAAANVNAFGNTAAAAFNKTAAAAQTATVASTKFAASQSITASNLKGTQRALSSLAGNLALNASFFAGPAAQQFVYPLVLFGKELKGVQSAMKLAGIGFSAVSLGLVGLTGLVAIGATGWSAYKAKVAETKSELEALNKQAALTKTVLESLSENRGRLPEGVADRLTEQLKASAPDLAIKKAKEELAELQRNRENILRRNADVPGIEKLFDDKFGKRIAELQATVAKPPSSPIQREAVSQLLNTQTNAESLKNLEEIRKLTAEISVQRLQGFAKERAEAQHTFDIEIAALEKRKLQNPTAEEQAEVDRAADALRAQRDEKIAESYRKEREAQQALAEEQKKFYREKEQAAEKFYDAEAERINALAFQIRRQAATPAEAIDLDEAAAKAEVDKTISDHAKAEELKALITEDYAQRRKQAELDLAEAQKAIREQQIQGVKTMFGNMAAAAQIFGQKGFAVAKGFAIAQATIDTAQAAIGAYNSVVRIPYVGPILAPIAAAAAVAAGAAQIATISSQQPRGFQQGGFTGTGRNDEPAGIVHRNEWVMPANVVAREGPARLAAFQRGESATGGGGGSVNQITVVPVVDKHLAYQLFGDNMDAMIVEAFKRRGL